MADQIPLRNVTNDDLDIDHTVPQEIAELDLYQKREKIYTRQIQGFFQRIREFTGWPLLMGYLLLPWMDWNGRQMVLFDLPARQFHILGLTLWPQDFPLLAWTLIIAAFALFFFTTLFGRVWCGYSCPQTVWTSIFMWMEQKAEGSRNQRIKLDQAPWSLEKVLRKSIKHIMWLYFAFLTGFTFVAYFTPSGELIYDLATWNAHPWAVFWIVFFTAATYMNAGWLREQVCMYMCPYARFQAAMFDSNTLIVSYDKQRGEPRGGRKKGLDPANGNLGACIDCQLCVQVCPTGIDIRNGLQYECIGCALCIDACNSIMDKMGYARDLISYTTENHLLGKPERLLRPKVIGYGLALVVMVLLFAWKLWARTPLELDAIRDRGQLFVESTSGQIENSFTLRAMNKSQRTQHLRVSVSGLPDLTLQISGGQVLELEAGEVATVPVRVNIPRDSLPAANSAIVFTVVDVDDPAVQALQESRFLGPSSAAP